MSASAPKSTRGPRVPLMAELPTPQQPQPVPLGTPNLDAAVLRVQRLARPLVRNAPGQIQNRTYTYVTLSAVTDEVLPLLVAEDLLWKVFPTVLENGAPGLRYRMTHLPSGESDEDTMPLPCDATMQGLGSGITYGRRYALTAYLNLTIDEDDDGASANLASRQNGVQNAQSNAQPQPQAAPAKPSQRPANAKQKGMLNALAAERGLSAGDFANLVLNAAGDPPRAWRSEEHADQTLKRLIDRLPANLVTAVKTAIVEGTMR